MTDSEILQHIAENCLCVRRLPFETVTSFYARNNDETREGFTESWWLPTDEYFKNNYSNNWEIYKERFYTNFPNGKKLLKQVKKVTNGGWWYVKEIQNTDSTIIFNRKYDKFFAPTLKEAIQLYLDEKNK